MKERPILFSAPMVRAILDGSKTQTRRIIKPQPIAVRNVDGPAICPMCRPPFQSFAMRCPYGKPGDRLWVKENFHLGAYVREPHAQGAAIAYAVGKSTCFRHMTDAEMDRCRLKPDPRPWAESKTIPCLLMPRWASRISLEITGIRVERLNDISENDACWEGIDISANDCNYVETYRQLWECINGPGSWDANPWVWVIEFKRVERGEE